MLDDQRLDFVAEGKAYIVGARSIEAMSEEVTQNFLVQVVF